MQGCLKFLLVVDRLHKMAVICYLARSGETKSGWPPLFGKIRFTVFYSVSVEVGFCGSQWSKQSIKTRLSL